MIPPILSFALKFKPLRRLHPDQVVRIPERDIKRPVEVNPGLGWVRWRQDPVVVAHREIGGNLCLLEHRLIADNAEFRGRSETAEATQMPLKPRLFCPCSLLMRKRHTEQRA